MASFWKRLFGAGGGRSEAPTSGAQKSPEAIAEERIELAYRTGAKKLDLSALGLRELPASIGRLTQLQLLNLSINQLTALPDTLGQLSQVQHLQVWSNLLTTLPDTLGQLSQLQSLDVENNQLTALPDTLGQLTQLRYLNVAGNQLTALPETLGRLTQLQRLYVWNNKLTTLPHTLAHLSQLQELYVGGNQLTGLPDSLGHLSQLQSLYVGGNQLTALPESLGQLTRLQQLYLHDNPALGLPPEVLGPEVRKGPPANPAGILAYYFSSRTSRPLNEAKMILVGRGGVGKTSLVQRLVHGGFDPHERKTDGIAITAWSLQVGQDRVRLNIWDFGGQEILHATHQFFFTKRSLYLLVLNAREGEQDANVEYWLRLIESFGGDSPVIVVINQIKQHAFDLNRRGLQAKFPSVRAFIQTDCEVEIGLDELRRAVLRETDGLEHLRDPFPASWFQVKDTLSDLPKTEGQNFIPFHRYQELCTKNGVNEAAGQEKLVGFLHDLGIVVNFRDDPRLAETHVLNPDWVTNGIYKILNAETLARRHGELRLSDLLGVLPAQDYPPSMHLYLLDLMRKFELCYEFYESAGRYLMPELLGKEEPDLAEFAASDALRFEYTYNILPEGLLPRFIVRSRALNKELPCWRTGVVLAWEGNRAVVKADVQDRRVSIAITGPMAGRRRLLAVIRADLEHIHRSIAKLDPTEQVPVPGQPGLAIEYAELRVLETAGEKELTRVHNGKVVKVQIGDLLGSVEEASLPSREPIREAVGGEAVRVAFSYSHKDEELRDQLETHLKLLQRQGHISTWHDRKIMPGDKWVGVIDDSFRRADLILLLVSADFLASDYCYEIEMKTALERHSKAQAKVVPVILRACDWQDAPFGKLQGLPKDTNPVTSWPIRDEAWNDVAQGIKRTVDEMRGTRELPGPVTITLIRSNGR